MRIDRPAVRRAMCAGAMLVLAGGAMAQGFQPGERVMASPFYSDDSFEACTVVAPVQGGYHVNCDASGEYVVGNDWIRAGGAEAPAAATQPPAGSPQAVAVPPQAAGAVWLAGQTVLGSPAGIDTGWQRCVVMGGPNDNGYYDLDCASWYLNADGDRVRYTNRTWVEGDWVRADDPGFEPDMQVAAVHEEEAARDAEYDAQQAAIWDDSAPLATADAPGGPVQPGNYQCYSGAGGNMKISFGAGTYSSAGANGRFTQDGPLITFADGPLEGFYGYVYAGGDVQLRTAPDSPSAMQCDIQ